MIEPMVMVMGKLEITADSDASSGDTCGNECTKVQF